MPRVARKQQNEKPDNRELKRQCDIALFDARRKLQLLFLALNSDESGKQDSPLGAWDYAEFVDDALDEVKLAEELLEQVSFHTQQVDSAPLSPPVLNIVRALRDLNEDALGRVAQFIERECLALDDAAIFLRATTVEKMKAEAKAARSKVTPLRAQG